MKALVLYRSFYGNTRRVAEAMGRQIDAQGNESVVQDVRQRLPDLKGIDLVLIGAPTRMARVNLRAIGVLGRLRRGGLGDKPVVVFDTYGPLPKRPEEMDEARKWYIPGAAGILQNAGRKRGLNVHPEALRCEVREMKGPLADGQEEKAVAFVKQILATVGKKR